MTAGETEAEPVFVRSFEPAHGEAVSVAPDVRRVTVNNPGPFTFHGTNTYLVGKDTLAIIDPGPDDPAHLDALERAIAGRPVSHVFVSHTHRDHAPMAAILAERTGARLCAEGPHRPSRPLHAGETNPFAESSDMEFTPDHWLYHGETIACDGFEIEAIATPGHTANHMAFALSGSGIVFSGDHVMAWSTTIVAPPDGAMGDYMASLETLLAREDDRIYFPGHGGPVNDPRAFVRGIRTHRRMREAAILDRLKQGDRTIPEIVGAIYRDTDPRLHGAAALSVLAHVEDLMRRGSIVSDGPARLSGHFALS